MKKFLLTLAALAFISGAWAQVAPDKRDVPKEYRKELKRIVADYENQVEEGWDIVLDPIEAIPTDIIETRAEAFGNWGEKILIPDDIRQRIRTECKGKVVVKIGDTAGSYSHADLQKGQLPGSNYSSSPLPDVHGHSTHVAGIIAGDVGGLAWELVDAGLLKFKPVKVLSDNGSGSFSWVANAIASERKEDETLISQGTGVIYNFSLGGGTALVGSVETELKKSTEAGVLFVCAAGNSGGPVNYPGMSAYTSATSALQQSLVIAGFSSRGPEVTTSMPGVSIYSTWKDNTYASLSGTSMASPFAAAAAAIAVSKWGLMSQGELHTYLAKVAQDLGEPGKDNLYGWGISYIRAILDTDPDTGNPPPPPPPPPDDDPPVKPWPKRSITFPIPGDFTMYWQEYTAPGEKKPQRGPIDFSRQLGAYQFGVTDAGVDFLTVDEPGVTELRRLSVRGLALDVETEEETGAAAEKLSAQVQEYFTNRAVYMSPPADHYTATYFTAYFLDMLLQRREDGYKKIRVLEITGVDEKGRPVRLTEKELKDIQ